MFHVCSIWRHFQNKQKDSQLSENLNNANIISMPMFATYFCPWGIANRHFRRKNCFLASQGSENVGFNCWARPIVILVHVTSIPMFYVPTPKGGTQYFVCENPESVFQKRRIFWEASGQLWSFDGCSGFTFLAEFFVDVTVTNACLWPVKNLFWLVNQTCHKSLG